MGMVAILVMWPDPFEQLFIPPYHEGYIISEIWLLLAQLFQRRGHLGMEFTTEHAYTISSPRSLQLRWAKNVLPGMFVAAIFVMSPN